MRKKNTELVGAPGVRLQPVVSPNERSESIIKDILVNHAPRVTDGMRMGYVDENQILVMYDHAVRSRILRETATEQMPLLKMLVAVARTAYALCDGTEDNGQTLTVDKRDFEELSQALDQLDSLPEPPGCAATGPAKAEWLLGANDKVSDATS